MFLCSCQMVLISFRLFCSVRYTLLIPRDFISTCLVVDSEGLKVSRLVKSIPSVCVSTRANLATALAIYRPLTQNRTWSPGHLVVKRVPWH